MGKVYDQYCKLALKNNTRNNANLIYNLVAIETDCDFKYSIEKGHTFNQFWFRTKVEDGHALLQATQNEDGTVQLSIQGLSNVFAGVKNFIDYSSSEEHELFMEYLRYF